MAAGTLSPPEGFVLDKQISPPEGFVLDPDVSSEKNPPQPIVEPLDEEVAFERAGMVWDTSVDDEIPLEQANMYFYPQADDDPTDPFPQSPPPDNRVGFSEEFINQWTGVNAITKIPITGGIIGALESVATIEVANRVADPSFDYEKFNNFRDRMIRSRPLGNLGLPRDGRRPGEVAKPSDANREDDLKFIASVIKDLEQQQRKRTFGGKVAAGLSQLPTWMIEFAATGGLAKLGDKAAKKAGEKLLGKYVKTAIGKTAIKAAGLTTGAVVRTSTGLLPRVGEKAVNRQELIALGVAGKEGWATSLAKAWGDVVIESFSEETGGLLTKGGGALLAKLPFGKKFIATLQSDWMKLTGGSADDFTSKVLAKAGYSSILGEMGEERVGTILREATGVSDRKGKFGERIWEGIKEDFQPENLGSELVTLLAPASVRRGMTMGVSLTKGISVPTEAEQLNQAIEVGEVPFDNAEDAKGYAEKAAEVALREGVDVTITTDLADNTVTVEAVEDEAEDELVIQEDKLTDAIEPLTEEEQASVDFLVSEGETPEEAERLTRISSKVPDVASDIGPSELDKVEAAVQVDNKKIQQKGKQKFFHGSGTEGGVVEFKEGVVFVTKDKNFAENIADEQTDNLINRHETETGFEPTVQEVEADLNLFDINNPEHKKQLSDILPDTFNTTSFAGGKFETTKEEFFGLADQQSSNTWVLFELDVKDKIKELGFDGWIQTEKGTETAGVFDGRKLNLTQAQQANIPTISEESEEKEEKRIISKDAFDAALKRLGTIDKLKAGLDPQQIKDAAIVGGYLVETGVRKFAAWSKKMIELVGESVKPHLKGIWDNVNPEQAKPKAKKKPTKPRVTTKQKEAEETIKQRGFISSIKTALPELRVEGTYIPRSTDELSIKAKNLVADDIKKAEALASKGDSDKSVATASELLKYYNEQAQLATDQVAKDAFYDKAATIASDIAAKLTEAGRTVQAAIILTRLTPEGQVRFAAREIQKFNEDIEKTGGGKFGLKKKIPELTPKQTEFILEEMAAIEAMPPGEDKAKRFQKLQNFIADLVPTPLFKKLTTIWKAGLLTGLKTSGLNIMSTAANVTTEIAAKIPATIVDKAISIGTGKRTVTVSIQGLGKGTVQGTKRGFDYLTTGYDERNIGTKLDYKRVNMGKGRLARALQLYTDSVFRLLGAEDQPFYYAAKTMSLYEQAKVAAINEGLKGKKAQTFIDNLMQNPTEDMIKNASKDAEGAVFQNKTKLGDLAKGIQELGGGIGEIVVPFGRTPSAVAMQIVNYSPVGAVKTIIDNIGKGKFDQRDFVTGLGKSIVGAIPLVIGAALWEAGMLTLDYPKTEKERELWKIEGRKANSIKVDGKWRTIQSFGPAGNLLIVGGHFKRAFQDSGSPSEAMTTAILGSGKSFTEQTFLQGVNQFTSALQDPERSGPRLARGLVSSVIPTIVGDVARATDPLERRTGTIAARVKAKIPGLRQTLEPQITVLGEERKVTANPIEIMIDPTRPAKDIATPVVKELRRLFDAGFRATPSLMGNRDGYEALTPEENTELWKRTGQITKDNLTVIVANKGYQRLSDEQKAKGITEVIDTSREVAKSEAVAREMKGLKGKALTDKIIELSDSGLLTSDLVPGRIIDKLKKLKEKTDNKK
jgi:hypothetical protein